MSDIKVACLGLAFKPDIDDLRESPALQITLGFGNLGCQVLAVEPHITELPARLTGGTIALTPLEEAIAQADVICVLVKHSAFGDLKEALTGSARLIDVVGL
jgi:UDP-N-acetyl-D-mannosaminuronic acid dehydrogenase